MRKLKQKVVTILSVIVITTALILPVANVHASTLTTPENSKLIQTYSTVDPDPW